MKTWWRRQSELDDDQREAIELPIDGNFLVTGPPGSGKTNILVLRAQYISSARYENTYLIVYTSILREFIATGSGDTVNIPRNRILTFASWVEKFIKERGLSLPEGFRDLSEPRARKIRLEKLEEATENLNNDYFDSLIVDEVQDLKRREIEALSRLTSRLFMAGDGRQRIYKDDGGLVAARNALGEGREVKLRYHYRIGPAICEAADRIRVDDGPQLSQTENYQDSNLLSRIKLHPKESFLEQCQAMVEPLSTQLRTYSGEWIGIIVNRKDHLALVFDFLEGTSLAGKSKILHGSVKSRQFDADCPICIMTLHSAKGIEFRAVHWLGACDVPYFSREKAFTVITRAKTALDVYHTDDLRPELSSALAERQAPSIGLPE